MGALADAVPMIPLWVVLLHGSPLCRQVQSGIPINNLKNRTKIYPSYSEVNTVLLVPPFLSFLADDFDIGGHHVNPNIGVDVGVSVG